MATMERVTVTLPTEVVACIDQIETNRSRFIAEAVAHELAARRHQSLLLSIQSPHMGSPGLADEGLADWGAGLPPGDEDLVDIAAGKPLRWIEGRGWVGDST